MDRQDTLHQTAVLRAIVRKQLKLMLKLDSWSNLAERCPPLAAEEIATLGAQLEEADFESTVNNFRIDFTRPWHSFPFNERARRVFCIHVFFIIWDNEHTLINASTFRALGDALDTVVGYCRRLYRAQTQ